MGAKVGKLQSTPPTGGGLGGLPLLAILSVVESNVKRKEKRKRHRQLESRAFCHFPKVELCMSVMCVFFINEKLLILMKRNELKICKDQCLMTATVTKQNLKLAKTKKWREFLKSDGVGGRVFFYFLSFLILQRYVFNR
jgi:hypothetical protein